jgi:hypothetical protein
MAEVEQFILSGSPPLVKTAVAIIESDSDSELVSVSGNPDKPERIVARMPAASAAKLRASMGGELLVERDEPLFPST